MAKPARRPGLIGRFLIHQGRFFNDETAEAVGRAGDRARKTLRGLFRTEFTCTCCPGRSFWGHRAVNAHHLARHGGYWGGKAATATGRKIGKAADAARRHARGMREAHGLIDHMGNRTARGASRPELKGRVSLGQLRGAHRHDRDHERAGRHDGRADRHEARGNHARAERHRATADDLRNRHPQPGRPVPVMATTVRPVPADTNGHRPEPARTPPNGRTRT